MRICSKCKIQKDESEFYKRLNGLRGDCKECFKEKHRENWRKNSKIYLENNPRGNRTLKKLGLKQEFFKEQLILQDKKCKICGEEKKLVVDHCHKKNKFRGLLCNSCNMGLGRFNDDIIKLQNAIKYLSAHNQ